MLFSSFGFACFELIRLAAHYPHWWLRVQPLCFGQKKAPANEQPGLR